LGRGGSRALGPGAARRAGGRAGARFHTSTHTPTPPTTHPDPPDRRDLPRHPEERVEPRVDAAQRVPGGDGAHERPRRGQPPQLRRGCGAGPGWVGLRGAERPGGRAALLTSGLAASTRRPAPLPAPTPASSPPPPKKELEWLPDKTPHQKGNALHLASSPVLPHPPRQPAAQRRPARLQLAGQDVHDRARDGARRRRRRALGGR
jgi:hypothetical protein